MLWSKLTYGVETPSTDERVVHQDAAHVHCPISLDDTCISRCGRGKVNDNTCEITGTHSVVLSPAFDTSIPPR